MSYGRASLVWLACVLCYGCSDLPSIAGDVCGNGVIDGAETCDGFGRGEVSCRPPGELGACQLDCSLRADATRPACPTGFGCDEGNLCREATGKYVPTAESIAGNAFSLLGGDFDGDGRTDILSQQPAGSLNSTTFRVLYFDQAGKLERTWSSPASVVSVAVTERTADGRANVVISDGRLGVLLGQTDKTLLSLTYPSYFIPDNHVRLIGPLLENSVEGTLPILIFAEAPEGLTLAHPRAGKLEVFVDFAGSMAELAGEPALGRLFDADVESPCNEVVIAMRGQDEVSVFSVCRVSPDSGDVEWLSEARVARVPLQPPAAIEHGPLLADIDGDGHIDLLLGTEHQTYVAFSDGRALSAARPLRASVDSEAPADVAMPLAIGDFTGDGKADLIYPTSFLTSQPRPDESSLGYRLRSMRLGVAWTEAHVADFNGNGFPDVVGASRGSLYIDFYNGSGGERINLSTLETERPPEHLTVGDFDGDLIMDLAFAQKAPGEQRSTVAIAFGNSAGAPNAPRTVAQVADLRQLGSLPDASSADLGSLYLLFDQEDASGVRGSAVAWFTRTGDRELRCLVDLTTFAEDGSIQAVPGLVLTTGSFLHQGQTDSVLFTSNLDFEHPEKLTKDLWLLTDLQSARGRPERLGYELDPRVTPLPGPPAPNALPEVNLQLTAADLDRDGLSELIVLAPDASGERCYITTGNVTGDQPPHHLSLKPALELAETCLQSSRLAAVDVDGDDARELLLLTSDSPLGRKLLVLWNDGQGGFSSDALSIAADVDEAPAAFSALPKQDERTPALIAYVGAAGLSLLRPASEPHSFKSEHVAVELAQPTGVLAADIDGDGISDLAVADQGNLHILRAELTR